MEEKITEILSKMFRNKTIGGYKIIGDKLYVWTPKKEYWIDL